MSEKPPSPPAAPPVLPPGLKVPTFPPRPRGRVLRRAVATGVVVTVIVLALGLGILIWSMDSVASAKLQGELGRDRTRIREQISPAVPAADRDELLAAWTRMSDQVAAGDADFTAIASARAALAEALRDGAFTTDEVTALLAKVRR